MKREDWESLIGNPGWQALRGYLSDYRERVKEEWARGAFIGQECVNDAASKCQIFGDLADLEWRDVAKFYGLWTDEDEKQYYGAQQ